MAQPLLKPQHVGYVHITDHADEKLDDLDGWDIDRVVGRVHNVFGRLYWDESEERWELYDDEEVVAIKFALDTDGLNVEAHVITVFEVSNPGYRYSKDHYTRWWI